MRFNGMMLSSGTGFLVKKDERVFLITNRHNVTGRHQETGDILSRTGGTPNEISIQHNKAGQLGRRVEHTELLHENNQPRWFQHPSLGDRCDFIALRLRNISDIEVLSYDVFDLGPDIIVGPAGTVSVVGFPFGLRGAGYTAIWATGFVASEPELNFNDLPAFLIDCRSRPGQSGSPVIAYRAGGASSGPNGLIIHAHTITRLLGIYSGRIRGDSDLGLVWKTSAIREMMHFL